MVAKKGSKRQAGAAAPQPKKAKVDPTTEGVLEAISQATDLPESCRKMLEVCVLQGLRTPQDQRHEVQGAVVSMIGEVVEGVRAKLQATLASENGKLGDVETRRAELQAAVTAAEELLAAASQDLEAKTQSLIQTTEAAAAARQALEVKQEEQRSGDAAMNEAREAKAAIESGIQGDLRVLIEGTSEELVQHYENLVPVLESGVALDESLMTALPSVCAKKATERGSFDSMVLEQLRQRLQEKAVALAKVVEEAAPAAQVRAAAVQEAQAAVDAAVAAQEAASSALDAASAAKGAAEETLAKSQEAVASFEPEYAQAAGARDELAGKLENFQLYNVNCFELLRDTVAGATAGGA